MKILLASQDLSADLSAAVGRQLMQQGLADHAGADLISLPFDGRQEDLIAGLQKWNSGQLVDFTYYGPNWESARVTYLLTTLSGKLTAIIDTSVFANRQSISHYDEHDLFHASSYGLGQLILDAVTNEAQEVVLLIDDTCVIDGGLGMLQALGALIADESGDPIPVGENPLINFDQIDFSKPDDLLKGVKLTVLARETSTYTGGNSQLVETGKEIGILPEHLVRLDLRSAAFNRLMRKERELDLTQISGSGAGGGIAGALACLGAEITDSTYAWLFEQLKFAEVFADVDVAFLAIDQVNQTRFPTSFVGELARFFDQQQIRTILFTLIRITPAEAWNLPHVSTFVLPKIMGIKLPVADETVTTANRELEQSLIATTHEVAKLI